MIRNLTSNCTPLRNSILANTPFRSPINSGLTSKDEQLLSKSADFSESKNLKEETTTPKRSHSVDGNCLMKKRKVEIEGKKTTTIIGFGGTSQPSRLDLSAVKRRIRSKKQEIEKIKIKLSYQKKHKTQEVNIEIDKWRNACHKALFQFQRDWNENNSEVTSLKIEEIMAMLNIPSRVIKLPDDFED